MSRYGQKTRLTGGTGANTINYWFGGGVATQILGGNEIKTVGSYKYHFFTANGTLTVPTAREIEICSIGGGGGGGAYHAGGGGGAEVDYWTSVSATTNDYDVVVGAKGNKGLWNGGTPSNGTGGGTSKFSLGVTDYVTSLGGGRGGTGSATETGGNGGSGGGAAALTNGTAGGAASGSNTFAGGAGARNGNNISAGGGGGATVAGSAGVSGASSSVGGAGGAGLTLTTIDSNLTAANFTTLAGMTVISSGGGGSCWTDPDTSETTGLGGTGAGNGGNGLASLAATSATSYGSGGGGGSSTGSGFDGGDGFAGLVIVRYAV